MPTRDVRKIEIRLGLDIPPSTYLVQARGKLQLKCPKTVPHAPARCLGSIMAGQPEPNIAMACDASQRCVVAQRHPWRRRVCVMADSVAELRAPTVWLCDSGCGRLGGGSASVRAGDSRSGCLFNVIKGASSVSCWCR